jgi:hypothetical protein
MADNMILNNINGEYVKFYYTTNSILPQTLKRTGAIIIYDNKSFHNPINSYDTSYNSIYLGGELIMGGIGFGDIKSKEKAVTILGEWDDLKNTVDVNFKDLSNQIKHLLNTDINNYETTISGDNVFSGETSGSYKINKAVFDAIEAQYKPAEILSEINTVKYYFNNNEEPKESTSYNGDPVNVPVGATIKKVSKTVNIKLNHDSVSSFLSSYNYYTSKNEFLENKYKRDFIECKIDNSTLNSTEDIKTLVLSKEYNDYNEGGHMYYVSYLDNQPVFEAMTLKFGGTDLTNENIIEPLHIYDITTDEFGNKTQNLVKTKIKSIKNVILEHIHVLNSVKIKPVPFIFYKNLTSATEKDIIEREKQLTFFKENDRREIIDNKIKSIRIPINTTKFYFAIPKSYSINNIYYYENFNNIKTKTNITGLFVKLDITNIDNETQKTLKKSFINLYNKMDYINSDGKLNTNNKYLEYDFYLIEFGNNDSFNDETEIYIEFDNLPSISSLENLLLKPSDIIDDNKIPEFNFDKDKSSNNWLMLHNDTFLSSNWLSFIDENNYDNILGYKLKYLSMSNLEPFNNKFTMSNLVNNYNNNEYSHNFREIFNINSRNYYDYNKNGLVINRYMMVDELFKKSVYIHYNNNIRLDNYHLDIDDNNPKYNYERYIGNYIFTNFYNLNIENMLKNKLDNYNNQFNPEDIKFELLKTISIDIINTDLYEGLNLNNYIERKLKGFDESEYRFLSSGISLTIHNDESKYNDINFIKNNYYMGENFGSSEYKILTGLRDRNPDEINPNLQQYVCYITIPKSLSVNIKFNYKENSTDPNVYEFDSKIVENFRTKYIYRGDFTYKTVKYNIYEFIGDLNYSVDINNVKTYYILDNITISQK